MIDIETIYSTGGNSMDIQTSKTIFLVGSFLILALAMIQNVPAMVNVGIGLVVATGFSLGIDVAVQNTELKQLKK